MKIQHFIGLFLCFLFFSCGGSNAINAVRNGHLAAFGDESTIKEIFDEVAQNSTVWKKTSLKGTGYSNRDFYSVEASWKNSAKKKVRVQFVVRKDKTAFELIGAYIGKDFIDADAFVYGIYKALE